MSIRLISTLLISIASASVFAAPVPATPYETNENLTSRTFLNVGEASEDGCDKRVDYFDFNTIAKSYIHNVNLMNETTDAPCLELNYQWYYSHGLKTKGYQVVYNGYPTDYSISLSKIWRVLKEEMREGESWGNYNQRTVHFPDSTPFPAGTEYHKTTFIAVENVSVPAGDFQNCLVIEDLVNFGEGPQTRIYYFCNETGVARYIHVESGVDWQLQSYTEN
ncbi:MAG: hypothetical protein K6L76_06420 [Agarilytica sp.]